MMEGRIETKVVSTRRSGPEPRRVLGLSLLYLSKGHTRWSVDGRLFEIKEGQVLVVLPGQIFSGIESSDLVSIRVEQVLLNLPGKPKELTSGTLKRCLSIDSSQAELLVETLCETDLPVVRLSSGAERLFADIVRLVGNASPLEEVLIQSCMLQLITRVCLALGEQDQVGGEGRSEAERRVAQFLQELEEQCSEEWTLESMAENVGLKRSRFGTLCRQLKGESPSAYLNRLRIRHGRRLLRITDLSVTTIAFDCGFASSQYFAKIFRRFQGHEPTHYRRMLRGSKSVFLKGDATRNVAYAECAVGPGDCLIDGEITLDRLGETAASLEFGRDRFGFDSRAGRFFLEGETFGDARFFARNAEYICEGSPFRFLLERKGKHLELSIDGRTIVRRTDDPRREIGRVGLRPMRNGIEVVSFEVNGKAVVLKSSEDY
ncbi:MAG: helix-turn-helix transcriptional regulator [Opitutales bacterium]